MASARSGQSDKFVTLWRLQGPRLALSAKVNPMLFSKILLFALALVAGGARAQYVHLDAQVMDRCQRSAMRSAEITLFDVHALAELFARHREVPVPAQYRAVFERLVQASPALASMQLRLRAYAGKGLNAHEADHGVIVVSDSAWTQKRPLSEDEFAAMVAHELAHLNAQDSRTAACQMLALSGSPELTLTQAVAAVAPEMLDSSFEIARVLRGWSQEREMRADVAGAELLEQAGFDPQAMVALLARLITAGEAFNRGSHPQVHARIANLNLARQSAAAATTSRVATWSR